MDAQISAQHIADDLASLDSKRIQRAIKEIDAAPIEVLKTLAEKHLDDDRPAECQWCVYVVSVPYPYNESDASSVGDNLSDNTSNWTVGDSILFAIRDRFSLDSCSRSELRSFLRDFKKQQMGKGKQDEGNPHKP